MTSRTLRAAVLGALVGSLAVAGMVGSAFSAPAAPEAQAMNRVAIVVDTGSGPVSRCVSFAEDSISGIEALNRAGLAPVVRGFSGEGGAVCGLSGVGCPADSSCLTCQAPNYWAYYRADNGAGGFAYSSVGAGAIAVTDGDVEGWRWGTGAAPSYRSFGSICPLQPPPTTTTTTTTNPPPPGGGNGNGNGSGGADGPGQTGGGPTSGPPTEGTAPGATTTVVGSTTTVAGEGSPEEGGQQTTSSDDDAPTLDGEEAAARSPLEDDGGSGSARTWLAFVALLGGFALAGWRIRRVRSR